MADTGGLFGNFGACFGLSAARNLVLGKGFGTLVTGGGGRMTSSLAGAVSSGSKKRTCLFGLLFGPGCCGLTKSSSFRMMGCTSLDDDGNGPTLATGGEGRGGSFGQPGGC